MAEDDRPVAKSSASWSFQGGMGSSPLRRPPTTWSACGTWQCNRRKLSAVSSWGPKQFQLRSSRSTKSRNWTAPESRRLFFRILLEDLDRWLDQNLSSTESWFKHPKFFIC